MADAMETILKDGKVVEFMAEVKQKDHKAWAKLKEWFKNLAKFLKELVDAYSGHSAQTVEGRKVAEFSQDLLNQIEQIWAEGAVAAGENYQTAKTQKNTTKDGGDVKHQSRNQKILEDKYYARLIDRWDGEDHGGAFRVCSPSKALLAVGIPDVDIWFDQSKASRQLKNKVEVDKNVLKAIPSVLQNPIAIAESYDNSVVVFGKLHDKWGYPIVVALRVNSTNRRNHITLVNKVRSVGTRNNNLDKLLADSAILYLNENKKETNKWFNALGRSTPFGGTKFGLIRSITFDLPKVNTESSEALDVEVDAKTESGTPAALKSERKNAEAGNAANLDATQSQQFKRWFGDWQNAPEKASKVVNADGTPKVVYHGSADVFNSFSYGHIGSASGVSILGDGFYFSDKKGLAKNYGKNMYACYLRMINPYQATEADAYKLNTKKLRSQGYDGVILEAPSGTVYMVFENTQIKSATDNIGAFDGSNPDIRYSDRNSGNIGKEQSESIVDRSSGADYDKAEPVYERYQSGMDIRNFDYDLWANAIAEAKQAYGLDEDESTGVEDYVGGKAYEWNAVLRGDPNYERTEFIDFWIQQAINGFSKFPRFVGRTFRNLSFSDQNSMNLFLQKHPIGKSVDVNYFASSSKDPNGYIVRGDYVVHMVIDGFGGRDISDSYGIPGQQEVVYLPGTKLRITAIKTANDGYPLIYAQEVNENGKDMETNSGGNGQSSSRANEERQTGNAGGKRYDLGGVQSNRRVVGDGNPLDAQVQRSGDHTQEVKIDDKTVYSDRDSIKYDDRYGDFDYSQLSWAEDLGVITKKDKSIFTRTINNEIFRGAKPQSANGEYIIDTGKCLMFTDGDFHNPTLSYVIVFATEYESLTDYAKRRIIDEAAATGKVHQSLSAIESIFGKGFVSSYAMPAGRANARQNRRRKGNNGSGNYQTARAKSLKERFAEEGLSHLLEDEDSDSKFSERNAESVSNRSLLANALEAAVQDDAERQKLQEYREQIARLDELESRLQQLNAQIKELSFAKGPRDTKKIRELRDEATKIANRISTYDKRLLRLEASAPLQRILDREKQKAYKRAKQKGEEALAAYRTRVEEQQKRTAEKWRESRRSAIESRERTALRHKIQHVVGELNQLLLTNDKSRHVPEYLRILPPIIMLALRPGEKSIYTENPSCAVSLESAR